MLWKRELADGRIAWGIELVTQHLSWGHLVEVNQEYKIGSSTPNADMMDDTTIAQIAILLLFLLFSASCSSFLKLALFSNKANLNLSGKLSILASKTAILALIFASIVATLDSKPSNLASTVSFE